MHGNSVIEELESRQLRQDLPEFAFGKARGNGCRHSRGW